MYLIVLQTKEFRDDEKRLRKDDWWIWSLIIMWKKNRIRGSREGMKLFRSTNIISKVRPFNKGILKLQKEFNEALRNSLKYVMKEGIRHLA
jgi:hypothetical protein